MWKEALPEKCPPESATGINRKVFRAINSNTLTEDDFQCYAVANVRYKNICKAYAISFFDTTEKILEAFKRKKLGNFIAEIELKENHGVAHFDKDSGHLSVWFYNTWEFSNFTILSLTQVNGI